MEREDKKTWKRKGIALRCDAGSFPSIVAIIASAMLIVAFFLPFASSVGDFRSSLEAHSEEWVDESMGITASDAVDLSLFEYAKAYGSMPSLGWDESWMILAAIIASVGICAAATLVFALLRKATPTAVFAFCTVAISRAVVWDFGSRGVVPTDSYELGIAPAIYLAAGTVVVIAAIWLFFAKFKAKRAARLQS